TGRIDPRSRTGLCVGGRGLQSRRPTRLRHRGRLPLRFAHTGLRDGCLCVPWLGGRPFRAGTDFHARAAGHGVDVVGILRRWNGDCSLDLASISECSESRCQAAWLINIYLGRGDGTLVPTLPLDPGGTPKEMTAADFDADGRADLAIATSCTDGPCGQSGLVV